MVKIILAQCLIQNNCYGIAQVQRTDISDHRNPYAGFLIIDQNVLRDSCTLFSKHNVTTYLDFEDFLEKNPGAKIYYATTKAPQTYTDVHYEEDCYIMFGKESAGIPEDILVNNQETCVRIPMMEAMITQIEEQQNIMAEMLQEIQEKDEKLMCFQEQEERLQQLEKELSELLQILPDTEELLMLLEEKTDQIQKLTDENQQWQELAQKLNSENRLLQKQNSELLNLNSN